jgi:hypothetical protein
LVYAALLALAALDAAGYGMLAPVIPEIAERTGTARPRRANRLQRE